MSTLDLVQQDENTTFFFIAMLQRADKISKKKNPNLVKHFPMNEKEKIFFLK